MNALESLNLYEAYWLSPKLRPSLCQFRHSSIQREQGSVDVLRKGLAEDAIAYDRGGSAGHFTASAAIIDPKARKTLLTHHRKLGIWVQLGGHCDGDRDLKASSKREGLEESGLGELTAWQPAALADSLPLDIDIHSIPGKDKQHDHYHFDFRYLWLADSTQPLICSEESLDLAWVDFDQLSSYSAEDSVLILIEKAEFWLKLQS